MKEVRYFYVPGAANVNELPEEEAAHALRVLRLTEGDEIMLMDGEGTFYRAVIDAADKRHCCYSITEALPQQRQWNPHLHLAMAPTKNMDRIEWLAEKATEIGFDELTFLRCQFSERTEVKLPRIDKIIISAVKQSRKAYRPQLNAMTPFKDFIRQPFRGDKYICHCYEQEDLQAKLELKDVLQAGHDCVVMIGPEGDFSIDEVKQAMQAGFVPVSLGKSRLRTETAALVAVHLMNLKTQ